MIVSRSNERKRVSGEEAGRLAADVTSLVAEPNVEPRGFEGHHPGLRPDDATAGDWDSALTTIIVDVHVRGRVTANSTHSAKLVGVIASTPR